MQSDQISLNKNILRHEQGRIIHAVARSMDTQKVPAIANDIRAQVATVTLDVAIVLANVATRESAAAADIIEQLLVSDLHVEDVILVIVASPVQVVSPEVDVIAHVVALLLVHKHHSEGIRLEDVVAPKDVVATEAAAVTDIEEELVVCEFFENIHTRVDPETEDNISNAVGFVLVNKAATDLTLGIDMYRVAMSS